MRIFSYIMFLLIVVLGLTFAFLNHAPVNFNYYFGSKAISLSLLLVLSIGVGIILGLACTFFYWLKLKTENYRLKNQLKNAEKEVNNLRNLPIKGP
jgi:lipopolysaccharide assembly protein A